MGSILNLFRRDSEVIGVCCNCGEPIWSKQEWVTIVAAPFDALRAHRNCHLGSAQDAALDWPDKRAEP